MAIVCVVTALLSLAQFAGTWVCFNYPFTLYHSTLSLRERLPFIVEMLSPALFGVLLIGGLGLLRWRSWSIGALRVYVVSAMALFAARGINGIMATIALQTSAYAESKPPVLPTAILTLLATLNSWVWPAFILYVLSRAEVKHLCSQKANQSGRP